jgi:hypothetical protein
MASSDHNLHENSNVLKRWIRFISYPFVVVATRMFRGIHFFEQFYIKLYNIYAFVSQMMFFVLCSLVFNEKVESDRFEEYLLMALKTLLFYSVFTYFTTKTKDILSSNRILIFHNWNLMEGICRIVIEWAKAIIVVICLREQGIDFRPSVPYAVSTFSYYLCTEKIFTDIFRKAFQYCAFAIFDDLEHLYVPLLLNIYTVTLSITIELYFFLTTKFVNFAFVCSYFLIYIRIKDSYYNYWKILELEKQTFDNFRNASQKQLDEYDDICAVCLNKMSKAKITPCNHYFHPNCLKECLKNSFLCPLCKLNF